MHYLPKMNQRSRPGRHFFAVLIGGCILLPGCGTNVPASGAVPASEADAAGRTTPTCGATPTLVLSANNLLPPDSGPAGVTAFLGAHGSDVFYEVLGIRPGNNVGAIGRLPGGDSGSSVITSFVGQPSAGFSFTPTQPPQVLFGVMAGTSEGDAQPFGRISLASFDGMSITTLTSTNGGPAGAPISDGESVFYIDHDGVKAVPLGGGMPSVLSNQLGMSVALVQTTLIIDDFNNNRILSLSSTGGTPAIIADNQVGPQLVQNCGGDICWVNIGSPLGGAITPAHPIVSGSLMRASVDGNVTMVATLSDPHGLTYDGTNFFVTAAGSVMRIPAAGGASTVLANMSALGGVAVDQDCVYWFSLDGIYALSKEAGAAEQ